MRAPTTTAPVVTAPDVVTGDGVEVLGLGESETLGFVLACRRRQDEAAAAELRGVAHWAELHRSTHVGSIARDLEMHLAQRGPTVLESHLGLEGELRLAGEGAFGVDEFAVCELASALGMSETAARHYVGQAVELRDRLPRLWDAVMAVRLPAWKARKVAEQTIPFNAAAADYVDRQLAPFAHTMSYVRILSAVDAAVLRHDPDLAAERAVKAAERRGVWVEDRIDGISEIHAVTDTPDAAAFDAALIEVATTLAALGNTDTEQARRARAVGVLADPQYALDLHATTVDTRTATPRPGPARTDGLSFHIHLHTDAVDGVSGVGGTGQVARVDRFGARSIEAVQRWITGLAPGAGVRVTPVVDLNEHISVDAYEIPERLRDQVEHRDLTCRFPWCGRRGRFDVDHIDPYIAREDGGPPGQTNTRNSARLCRFHHRVKTHGGWHDERQPDGTTLIWTSPLARTYAVDEHGTRPGDHV